MGSGCCGKLYEGNPYTEQNGLICKRRSAWTQKKPLPSFTQIRKSYKFLPNNFTTTPKSAPVGRAGLQNLGNTCYINAALQCLSNTQPLTDYFLSNIHEDELSSKSNGEISTAYGDLVKAQWQEDFESIQPTYLCNLVWDIAPQFEEGEQQDSQEFLTFFLNSVNEELNRSLAVGSANMAINSEEPEETQASNAWKEGLLYNSSIIVDLFQGQLKSTIRCSNCPYVSSVFETFLSLSLPIPSIENCSLEECIKEFTREELLANKERWKCHSCGHSSRAKKKIELWKFPPVLIVTFKRLQFRQGQAKVDKKIDFPLEGFKIAELGASKQTYPVDYELFAKIDYYGSGKAGHFVAQARNFKDQKWYRFDDEVVEMIATEEILNKYTYTLFYYNRSLEMFPTQAADLPLLWPHFFKKQAETELSPKTFASTGHSFTA